MPWVLLLVVLVLAFGGGYVGYDAYGVAGGIGPIGLVLLVLVVLWFAGVLR